MTSIYAHLEKPSMVDYPRHFSAVFFVSGCNFSCGFCHNASLMKKQPVGLTFDQLDVVCRKFKKDWVNGVVITGGEPTLAPDLVELIRFFKDRYGFAVKLDTNGSNPEQLAECLPLVDYVAMDIKCALSGYEELVGYQKTMRIERSIELIRTRAKDYEFRTTVIESVHTDEQIDAIRPLVESSKRYALQAFIPRDELPRETFRIQPRTTAARLNAIKERLNGSAAEILLRGA